MSLMRQLQLMVTISSKTTFLDNSVDQIPGLTVRPGCGGENVCPSTLDALASSRQSITTDKRTIIQTLLQQQNMVAEKVTRIDSFLD